MDASPATPLTIIMVEDSPVDIYLIRWVLKVHELSHVLEVIDNGHCTDEHTAPLLFVQGGDLAAWC